MRLSNKRLLIVDDETEICHMVQMVLAYEGCSADCAYTVEQAREKLKSERYDAVLTDLQLPDGNGIDLVSELVSKARQDSQPPPAIVVTTGFSHLSHAEIIQSGADEFVAKPFDVDDLVSAVTRAIARRQGAETNPAA